MVLIWEDSRRPGLGSHWAVVSLSLWLSLSSLFHLHWTHRHQTGLLTASMNLFCFSLVRDTLLYLCIYWTSWVGKMLWEGELSCKCEFGHKQGVTNLQSSSSSTLFVVGSFPQHSVIRNISLITSFSFGTIHISAACNHTSLNSCGLSDFARFVVVAEAPHVCTWQLWFMYKLFVFTTQGREQKVSTGKRID